MTEGLIGHPVLITGGTGFIGSRLTAALLRDGVSVQCLVRYSSSVTNLENLGAKILPWNGETESLEEVFEVAKPRVVIHLATKFLAAHKSSDVVDLVNSNILVGSQLLECASKAKVTAFINAGTFWQNYLGETYHPLNLYAATKQAFEDLLRYYAETTDVRFLTLRLVDSFGPGDTRKKLIYLLNETAKTQNTLKMSPGEQVIDLLHVNDIVGAFLIALRRVCCSSAIPVGEKSEIFSVSSGAPRTLREVVDVYERARNVKLPIEWGALPYRPREVFNFEPVYPVLPQWSPTLTLEQGFRTL